MRKINLLLFSILLSFSLIRAQVGINTSTPHTSAVLDVMSSTQGILLPRMSTAQKLAISNPAVGLLVFDTNTKCISQNVGTETSPVWICLPGDNPQLKSFYMPSVKVDASMVGVVATPLDLYAEYKKQFGIPTVVSTGAPSSIPYFPTETSLYYYITDYDRSVLQIDSLSADGKVSYRVLKKAEYATFMTVVFVVK